MARTERVQEHAELAAKLSGGLALADSCSACRTNVCRYQ